MREALSRTTDLQNTQRVKPARWPRGTTVEGYVHSMGRTGRIAVLGVTASATVAPYGVWGWWVQQCQTLNGRFTEGRGQDAPGHRHITICGLDGNLWLPLAMRLFRRKVAATGPPLESTPVAFAEPEVKTNELLTPGELPRDFPTRADFFGWWSSNFSSWNPGRY